MSNKFIERIDLCSECYNKKGNYFFFKRFFGTTDMRFFCKECAKKQSDKEGLGLI